MRYINMGEQFIIKTDAIALIKKFLAENGAVSVKESVYGKYGVDLDVTYGNGKKTYILVMGGKPGTTDMFVSEYETFNRKKTNEMYFRQMSRVYSSKAHWLFYVTGNLLYILPLKSFRAWFAENTDTFQSECLKFYDKDIERRRHGSLVPLRRIERTFSREYPGARLYEVNLEPEYTAIKYY